MATNYVEKGDTIDWTNSTGSAVSSGDVVAVGNILAVALVDIANGESGTLSFGVFNVPKVDAAVIAQGESLTWDVSVSKFDDNAATPATGDITGAPAVAWEGKGATTDETIAVLFTGVPGTVA